MDKWREESGDYFSEAPLGLDAVMETCFKNGKLDMMTRERNVTERPKKKLKGLFKGLKIEEEDIEEAKKSLFPAGEE